MRGLVQSRKIQSGRIIQSERRTASRVQLSARSCELARSLATSTARTRRIVAALGIEQPSFQIKITDPTSRVRASCWKRRSVRRDQARFARFDSRVSERRTRTEQRQRKNVNQCNGQCGFLSRAFCPTTISLTRGIDGRTLRVRARATRPARCPSPRRGYSGSTNLEVSCLL